MINKYQLICMSFDGDYVTERPKFESIDDAWEHSCNLGSKWYFYPFHFVIVNSTIKDTPDGLQYFINKRIKTIKKIFNQLSKKPELEGYDSNQFIEAVINEILVLSVIEHKQN